LLIFFLAFVFFVAFCTSLFFVCSFLLPPFSLLFIFFLSSFSALSIQTRTAIRGSEAAPIRRPHSQALNSPV